MLRDGGDPAFLTHYAARFAVTAQEFGVERGVEMEGVVDVRRFRIDLAHAAEAALPGGDGLRIEQAEIGCSPCETITHPVVREIDIHIDAIGAERVEIFAAGG